MELVVIAASVGGLAWWALWPAASLLAVALAYGLGRPELFGKVDADLRWSKILLLPYLVVQNAIWHLLRVISREPPFSTIAEGLIIGRRLLSHEYPTGLASIVDLTCEFSEHPPLHGFVFYLNLPILDGGCASPATLDAAVDHILSLPRPIYLHCAQGHSRTAMIAACLLIELGLASTVTHALALVRAARPRARLNRRQAAAVAHFFLCSGPRHLPTLCPP
jgi:hypothetical protein